MAMRLALAAMAFVLVAPVAEAGTRDDPELVDPTGDTFAYPILPAAGPLADAMDLVAVWVEASPSSIRLTMEVVDLAAIMVTEGNPAGDGRWWVEFEVLHDDGTTSGGEEPWDARVFVSQGTVWESSFEVFDPRHRESIPVTGGIDVASNLLWVDVPKSVLGVEGGGELRALASRTGTYFPAYPSWIGDDGTDGDASFVVAGTANEPVQAPVDNVIPDKEASGVPWTLAATGLLLTGFAARQRRNRGQ